MTTVRQLQSTKPRNSVASQASQKPSALANALAHLCLMKKQAAFTPSEARCWIAVLNCFPVETVNRAVLQLGLSIDPFPDLGKLIAQCQIVEANRNPAVLRCGPGKQLSSDLIDSAAKALGLDV